MSRDAAWFAAHVAGAPATLTDRAAAFLAAEGEGTLADRLAAAGSRALAAAEARGSSRTAALDLLAADALITLALLEVAARAPGRLASEASRLRIAAAGA